MTESMVKQVPEGILLNNMLELIEQQWVTEVDFEKLLKKMGLSESSTEIFMMTRVTHIIKTIPGEVFANEETKLALQEAAQECLDSKIEKEAEEEIGAGMNSDYSYGVIGEVEISDSNDM